LLVASGGLGLVYYVRRPRFPWRRRKTESGSV
jgi:hypothetical protein